MSEFQESLWVDSQYARSYRDNAENFIIDRQAHFFILRSFYRQFVGGGQGTRVLDLGCGDGILTAQLLALDPTIQATLVDGSSDMLAAARERLSGHPGLQTIQRSFEDLIRESSALDQYHFVMSAFAIHHLYLADKAALFRRIFEHLASGGYFLNIDTVLPNDPAPTDWYYNLYREWIAERERRLNLSQSFGHVPDEARYNPDNKLSTLAAQLEALKSIEFVEVECHYKYGIFVIYSGRKAE